MSKSKKSKRAAARYGKAARDKRRSRARAQRTEVATTEQTGQQQAPAQPRPQRPPRVAARARSAAVATRQSAAEIAQQYGYVVSDLRHIGIIAGSLTALLVLLSLVVS